MIGLLRCYLAERQRQAAARARTYQERFQSLSYGFELGAWLAMVHDTLAEALDHREENKAVLRLAALYPVTLSTARRYHRRYGDLAEGAIELELREGRTP